MKQDIEWHNASSMCDIISPLSGWRVAILDISEREENDHDFIFNVGGVSITPIFNQKILVSAPAQLTL